MKSVMKIAVATSLAFAFCAPAQAQSQGTPQDAPQDAAAAPQLKQAAAKRARAGADRDVRHCLKLPTNIEIHKCAHKYL